MQGGEEVTTKILILKGQGNILNFDPVRLFFRSACTADSYDPAIAHDVAWNQEIWDQDSAEYLQWIVFTPPCPQIRWAGPFAEERQMVYSHDTLVAISDLVEVSIFNVVSFVAAHRYHVLLAYIDVMNCRIIRMGSFSIDQF